MQKAILIKISNTRCVPRFNFFHFRFPPGILAGRSDWIPSLLDPALDVRQDVSLALSDGKGRFTGVHAGEIFLDGEVLAEAGRERPDACCAESSHELAVLVGCVEAIGHVRKVFALGDQIFFGELCHFCPFLVYMSIIHYRAQICTGRTEKMRAPKDPHDLDTGLND